MEPWLRETELPCDPALAAVVFAIEQAEEDVRHFHPPPSSDFQYRHLAGSLDRLVTYLEGRALSDRQLTALANEEKGQGESRDELLGLCADAFTRTREVLLRFPAAQFREPRYVGRSRVRTTAIGLIIHIAEHTQRHIGQIIAYSRAG